MDVVSSLSAGELNQTLGDWYLYRYGVTVSIMIAGFLMLDYVADLSLAQQLLLWGIFGVVFPLFFFRYSKSLWQCIDYIFNPVDGQQT